jgi:hypothetical protein
MIVALIQQSNTCTCSEAEIAGPLAFGRNGSAGFTGQRGL